MVRSPDFYFCCYPFEKEKRVGCVLAHFLDFKMHEALSLLSLVPPTRRNAVSLMPCRVACLLMPLINNRSTTIEYPFRSDQRLAVLDGANMVSRRPPPASRLRANAAPTATATTSNEPLDKRCSAPAAALPVRHSQRFLAIQYHQHLLAAGWRNSAKRLRAVCQLRRKHWHGTDAGAHA